MNGRFPRLIALLIVVSVLASLAVFPATAESPANEHFQRTWSRTDQPVATGQVSRTWMWGAEANTTAMLETYAEAPDGERTVQYFDKARMEITQPDADPDATWYVTNGLLVVELITGRMQVGDDEFIERSPATVNVAGDADDPTGPTYSTFSTLLDMPQYAAGALINLRVDREGNVTADPELSALGVEAAHFDEVTERWIAGPFWEFMNSSGMVWEDGAYTEAQLFEDPYFATGRPLTKAYWANVKVLGTYQDVLMQCFERRCLTYTPDNDPGWRVEAGNVGLHYYQWRYGDGATGPGDGDSPDALPLQDAFPVSDDAVALDLDSDGRIYLLDWDSDDVTVLDTDRSELMSWPVHESVAVNEGLAVGPDGVIHVIDAEGYEIERYTPDGATLDSIDASGAYPRSTAIDVGPDGRIYLLDSDVPDPRGGPLLARGRVRVFDADGALLSEWMVPGGRDLAAREDGVVVATDEGLRAFSPDGEPGWSNSAVTNLSYVVIAADGTIYVIVDHFMPDASTTRSTIAALSADGELVAEWTPAEVDAAYFVDLAIHDGVLYGVVSDEAQQQIHLYEPDGGD